MTFLTDTIALLERTPVALRALLTDLPESWTDTPDVPAGGWRPRDVVGHLVTGEQTDWIARAERILEHGTEVAFEKFDRTAMLERDVGVPLNELVDRFAALRSASLTRLRELVSDDLDRRGLHPTLGEVTLRELIATWAVHDLDHIAQIFAGLGGAYDAEVGPWRVNLGLLLRREDPSAVAG